MDTIVMHAVLQLLKYAKYGENCLAKGEEKN